MRQRRVLSLQMLPTDTVVLVALDGQQMVTEQGRCCAFGSAAAGREHKPPPGAAGRPKQGRIERARSRAQSVQMQVGSVAGSSAAWTWRCARRRARMCTSRRLPVIGDRPRDRREQALAASYMVSISSPPCATIGRQAAPPARENGNRATCR